MLPWKRCEKGEVASNVDRKKGIKARFVVAGLLLVRRRAIASVT